MATPFTAGVVALMLDCNGALDGHRNQVRSRVDRHRSRADRSRQQLGQRSDRRLSGGRRRPAAARAGCRCRLTTMSRAPCRTTARTRTPSMSGSDGVGKPIAATILIQGQMVCTFDFFGICFIWEWTPDLDARLLGPGGAVIWQSDCPLSGECGTVGQVRSDHRHRQRGRPTRHPDLRLHWLPQQRIGWRLRDGPLLRSAGGRTTPAHNLPPVAANDPYSNQRRHSPGGGGAGRSRQRHRPRWRCPYRLSGERAALPDRWSSMPTAPSTTPRKRTSTATTSFVYRADDGNGGSAQATATITVNAVNDPPVANAGPRSNRHRQRRQRQPGGDVEQHRLERPRRRLPVPTPGRETPR